MILKKYLLKMVDMAALAMSDRQRVFEVTTRSGWTEYRATDGHQLVEHHVAEPEAKDVEFKLDPERLVPILKLINGDATIRTNDESDQLQLVPDGCSDLFSVNIPTTENKPPRSPKMRVGHKEFLIKKVEDSTDRTKAGCYTTVDVDISILTNLCATLRNLITETGRYGTKSARIFFPLQCNDPIFFVSGSPSNARVTVGALAPLRFGSVEDIDACFDLLAEQERRKEEEDKEAEGAVPDPS